MTALWAVQALGLPLFAIVAHSTLYGGLRHHVYALPALAALAGYAVHRLTSGASEPETVGAGRRVLIGIGAIAALVGPTVDQLTLNPYAYLYKNALAGSVDTQWETDMHWVTAREALWHLPAGSRVLCYKTATVGTAAPPEIEECTNHPQVQPFLDEMGRRASPVDIGDDVWVIARRYNGSPPAAGCSSVADVTRRLRGREIVISYVLRCDPSVVDLPG